MIAGVMITLLLYRGAQVNTEPTQFPYGWGAFASHAGGQAAPPARGRHQRRPGHRLPHPQRRRHLRASSSSSRTRSTCTSSWRRSTWPSPGGPARSARSRSTPDMDMENVDEDTVFGVGEIGQFTWKQMLDFATCTECGRCQSACPAWTTDKPLSPKLLIMDLRDNMFASAGPLMSGEGEQTALVPNVIDPDVLWSCTTCGACVERVPGRHRAHRRHRRHAPLPGADGVRVPLRGGADAPQRREPGRPVGSRPGASGPSGRRASTSRSPSSTARSPTTSSTSTGSAVPARSTSGPARACRRRRACCTGPASRSPSWARRSRAPATPCAASATSTSTRSRAS